MLLCTTIIESGIDISSANTMIVNRADAFGLAQLYQLRGRVGRSKERAYAYLLVPARRAVTKDAQRRLEVLQAFTELGAGLLASPRTTWRSAARATCSATSSRAPSRRSGSTCTRSCSRRRWPRCGASRRGREIEPEVNAAARRRCIPDDYVPDVHQRLVLYKRFAGAQTPDELSDLRAELVDRFGEAPDEVDHLCELMLLKMDMRELRLRALEAGAGPAGGDARAATRCSTGRSSRRWCRVQGRVPAHAGHEARRAAGGPDQPAALLGEAKKVLRDLAACAVASGVAPEAFPSRWTSRCDGIGDAHARPECSGGRRGGGCAARRSVSHTGSVRRHLLGGRFVLLRFSVDRAPRQPGCGGRTRHMKRVLLAGLASFLFACGGGPKAPPLRDFSYGSPTTPSASQAGTASNAQSSFQSIAGVAGRIGADLGSDPGGRFDQRAWARRLRCSRLCPPRCARRCRPARSAACAARRSRWETATA